MFRTKLMNRFVVNSIKLLADNNGIYTRNLYSAASLGMDGFMVAREKTKLQINNVENFKTKMLDFVKDENSKNLIFTEDLKNMVHISEKDDVELLTQMIERFCTQSKETRFGNFVFGPPIMRLFYYLNDADTALKLFKNEKFDGFFDQLVTYQILLDMLFIQGRYQDILDIYDVIKSRQVQGGRSKDVLVLSLASCYKINSKASLEHAKKLWTEATASGKVPMRRAVTFLATLALNQGEPETALEVISNLKQSNYLTLRSIRALALSKIKRFDDAIQILRSVLEIDNPMMKKQTFPVSVTDQLKEDFKGNTNQTIQQDFEKVMGFLEKHGHIGAESLDDILCSEISNSVMRQPNEGFQRRDSFGGGDGFGGNNYERRPYRQNQGRYQQRNDFGQDRYQDSRARRPGLHELY